MTQNSAPLEKSTSANDCPNQSQDMSPKKSNARLTEGMIFVEGQTFHMGSDNFYPEEAPVHRVAIDGFWIDPTPVTNDEFRRFVEATAYVTFAEKAPDPNDYPGLLPEMLYAGSLTFTPPNHKVALNNMAQWWSFLKHANWRHPYGPNSELIDKADHPVVHIAYEDALAYAKWAGKDLPTEAEWELAARGGLDQCEFAWGDELTPKGKHMANTWQGDFPTENLNEDGYERTSPVTTFAKNGYGIYDMIGNTWEWTADWFTAKHPSNENQGNETRACCIPKNPRGGAIEKSIDPSSPQIKIPRKVIKGGSHLCAPNYCQRYRPAARHAQAVDTSTSHLGFRCIVRVKKENDASVDDKQPI